MMIGISRSTEVERRYRVVADTFDRRRQAQQSVFDGLTRQDVSQKFVAGLANPRLLRQPDHPLHGQHALAGLRIYEKRPAVRVATGDADGRRDAGWVDVTAEFTQAAGVPEARAWARALADQLPTRYRWWLLGGGVVMAAILVRCSSADAAEPISIPAGACAAACAVSAHRIISSRWNHDPGSRLPLCQLWIE